MDKELTIIIAGKANSGKSTMMLQLEKLLIDCGYDVELSFKNHPDYGGENTYHFHNKEQKDFLKKINVIKSSTKIILKEMLVNSEPKINKSQRESYTNS